MAKTESVYTRIEPKLKIEVEKTLSRLGLSTSEAINIFLNQVVMHKGLPFEVKVPSLLREEAELILMSKLKESEDAIVSGGQWLTVEESRAKLGL